jgi:hypothetical protein
MAERRHGGHTRRRDEGGEVEKSRGGHLKHHTRHCR